jgi:hypothetical protein
MDEVQKHRRAELWPRDQFLGPKDREGILITLMCEDKNAARQ